MSGKADLLRAIEADIKTTQRNLYRAEVDNGFQWAINGLRAELAHLQARHERITRKAIP